MSESNCSFEISRIAALAPQKLATVDFFGRRGLREVTFYELERGIRAIHALFEFFGVGQGSYVAVVAQNRIEVLEVFLAAFRVGAIPYAVNPNLSLAAIRTMFEEFPQDFIFLELDDLERIRDLIDAENQTQIILFGEQIPESILKSSGMNCQSYDVLRNSAWNIPTIKHLSVPQFIIFTSDSTGGVKAILRDFAVSGPISLDFSGIRIHENEQAARNSLLVEASPLFHTVGDMLRNLQAGVCIIMLRSFDATTYISIVARYQPSFLWLLPSHLTLSNRLMDHWQGQFSRLKLVVIGGAPCNETQLRQARELFQCPVVSCYGLTEGDPQFTFAGLDLDTLPANCVGRSTPSSQVRLVDLSGKDSDFGELHFRNESLFKEYFNNEELTQRKLKNGWFSTGDIFSRDEQDRFYYQGRIDDIFVCGDENIYSYVIEKLLLEHPSVEAACVVPCEDAASIMVPVAMVVQDPAAQPVSRQQLQEYCLEQGVGIGYPRWISVVNALPVVDSGKVDREKIKAVLAETYFRWLEDENPQRHDGFALDSSLVDNIARIIQKISDVDSVGVGDSVFRMGMSLLHVKCFCSRINEIYGIRLLMEDVFCLEYVGNIVAKIQQELDGKKVLDAIRNQK